MTDERKKDDLSKDPEALIKPLVKDVSTRAAKRVPFKAPGATGTTRGHHLAELKPSTLHPQASSTLRTIGATTAATTAGGAFIGAGSEAARGYRAYKDGELDGATYAAQVATGAVKGGAASGGRTVAALGMAEGAKQVAAAAGARSVAHVAGSATGTAVAFGVVEQAIDTVSLARGKIDRREYGTRTFQNAGSTGGGLGGAAAGAAAGSALAPGVGTVLGAIVGGVAGGLSGALAGRSLGEVIFGRGAPLATMDPEVARVLRDPAAFSKAAPEFLPITHDQLEIDHRQEGTFLLLFRYPEGAEMYALVIRFRRFEADAVLSRLGGSRPKVARGRVVGRRLEVAFVIGGRQVGVVLVEGERHFTVDMVNRVYYDLRKLV